MKETVLDVLMYLFEHYFDSDADVESDQESLRGDLLEAGFAEGEVSKAFDWLESLTVEPGTMNGSSLDGGAGEGSGRTPASRVFAAEEERRLDVECRGFLLSLEQSGVINPITRELIIDRIMALEADTIDLEQLKWVTLMVLFNQPGNESTFTWMEDVVFDGASERLH